jgi:hypothetical protein
MATLPQNLTTYHAKYYAYELTRRCPSGLVHMLRPAIGRCQS